MALRYRMFLIWMSKVRGVKCHLFDWKMLCTVLGGHARYWAGAVIDYDCNGSGRVQYPRVAVEHGERGWQEFRLSEFDPRIMAALIKWTAC